MIWPPVHFLIEKENDTPHRNASLTTRRNLEKNHCDPLWILEKSLILVYDQEWQQKIEKQKIRKNSAIFTVNTYVQSERAEIFIKTRKK